MVKNYSLKLYKIEILQRCEHISSTMRNKCCNNFEADVGGPVLKLDTEDLDLGGGEAGHVVQSHGLQSEVTKVS